MRLGDGTAEDSERPDTHERAGILGKPYFLLGAGRSGCQRATSEHDATRTDGAGSLWVHAVRLLEVHTKHRPSSYLKCMQPAGIPQELSPRPTTVKKKKKIKNITYLI